MTTSSHSSEPHLFLETNYFKHMTITLMSIPHVHCHKIIEALFELILAKTVCKIKLFQIIDKHIWSILINTLNFSTLICTFSRMIIVFSTVCYNLPPLCTSPCPNRNIVITFYPEFKVTFVEDHCIVKSFVFIKAFEVAYVTADTTTTQTNYQIKDIGQNS